MKILMVLTSHDRLGDTGHKTGFWLEEFAAPYYVFKDAGAQLVLASPKGGQPPLDPKSDAPDAQTAATVRFNEDAEALSALANTRRLKDVLDETFDAVFYPGGHGPAVFRHTRGALGEPLVKDKRLTAFSDEEEEAVGLAGVVPFSLEDALKKNGAHYERGPVWQSYVVTDGKLVTGQNPASSEAAADDVRRLVR